MDTIENAYAAPAHAPNHITRQYGVINSYIFGMPDSNCLFTTQRFGAWTTIKGRLLLSGPMIKPFWAKKSRKSAPEIMGFVIRRGLKFNILVSRPPKGTSLCETAYFNVFCVKIGAL